MGVVDQTSTCVQARHIIINGGALRIGSAAAPFAGKATITLHAGPNDRELPGFGSKSIAVRQGTLALHGRPKTPTWTQLVEGAPLAVGGNSLVVSDVVNWQAGDKIVVTPSSFYAEQVCCALAATRQLLLPCRPPSVLGGAGVRHTSELNAAAVLEL